ncbi:CoA transferase [Gordonia sp. (in: high G+C Gram-positive bacteria)]|uniref:CoA transferase n=1 Tax=Gordonia sp. (in: high G+C Gram-positive bacteria) TaxID=84139 RepID=UPI0016ADD75A|nr:CoA transferase [Gordonia sp. (in: high G+C Gram-positive bacteria)]NLG45662.1 2-methylfumaryl-CoA isomerase [Gordonia sp. (in: high G+C Gram-positive bacteria)]
MTVSNRPLAGVRVVEFASFVAGPSSGMALAQLGAELIRVDPIGGNVDYRRWPLAAETGASLYWNSLNRGKKSVTLDLRSDRGRDLLLSLATAPGPDAGIVIDNAVGRSWFSYDALSARRSDVIAVRVEGRADGSAAVDYTVNGDSGVASMTGPTETDRPVNHVLPAWDLLCGQEVVTAVLAALRRRDRTGEGAHVQIALSDVAMAAVANLGWYSEAAESGPRARHGNHMYGAFGTDFAAADGGRTMVVVLTPRQWAAVGAATGTTEVFAALEGSLGADFQTDEGRYAHRELIEAVLKPWFAARSTTQVHDELSAAGVLWGPYRTTADVAADFAADPAGRPVLISLAQPGIGTVISAHSPSRWDSSYSGSAPAADLGSDTDAVLAEVLGLSSDDLRGLHDDGVIA